MSSAANPHSQNRFGEQIPLTTVEGAAGAGDAVPLDGADGFHKLFPTIPHSETVVHDYQCSLLKNRLLRVGRLYLTHVRLCFSGLLCDPVVIEWDKITDITKKTTLIFDQVVITANVAHASGGLPPATQQQVFTGFMNGSDQPFKMMKALWTVRGRYASLPAETSAANLVDTAPKYRSVQPQWVNQPATSDAPIVDAAQPPRSVTPSKEHATPGERALSPAVVLPAPQPPALAASLDAILGDTSTPPTSENPTPAAHAAAASGTSLPNAPEAAVDPGRSTTPEAVKDTAAIAATVVGPVTTPSPQAPSPTSNIAPHEDGGEATALPRDAIQPNAPPGGTSAPLAAAPVAATDAYAKVSAAAVAAKRRPPVVPSHHRSLSGGEASVTPSGDIVPIVTAASFTSATASASHALPSNPQTINNGPNDILKFFPNVPKTEVVTDQFQCSYVSGVHRLGRMYVSQGYVLFSSVMMQEGVAIRIRDIGAVEKSQSLLVLEGITITLRPGASPPGSEAPTKYEFTSFSSRDRAFQLIVQYHHSVGASMTPPAPTKPRAEGGAPIAAAAPTPTAETTATPPPDAAAASATTADSSKVNSSSRVKKPTRIAKTATAPVAARFNTATSRPGDFYTAASTDAFDNYVTDWGTAGLSNIKNFLSTPPVCAEFDLPVGNSLADVFRVLFDDDTPFLTAYHAQRRDTDCNWEKWRPCGGMPCGGQRQLKCKTVVRALGETITNFVEYQKYALLALPEGPALLIQFSGQALGVIFSETFRCENLMIYRQKPGPSGEPQVSVITYGYINFLKWSVAKMKISSQCAIEMPICYNKVNEMAASALTADMSRRPSRSAAAAVAAVSDDEDEIADSAVSPLTPAVAAHHNPLPPLPAAVPQPATVGVLSPINVAAVTSSFPAPQGVYRHIVSAVLALSAYCFLWVLWGVWQADFATASSSVGLPLETAGPTSYPLVSVEAANRVFHGTVRPFFGGVAWLLIGAIVYVAAAWGLLPAI